MDGSAVTAFDAFALGLLFLSGILALTRGFVREFLSVTAFIVSALAVIFTYPVFCIPMRQLITPSWAADAITVSAIFILVYMAVTLITHNFTQRLHVGSDVGALNRSAGFVFGIVRGMALMGLALIMFNQLTPRDRMPGWLINARLYPAINSTARALQALAPSTAPVNDHPVRASSGGARPKADKRTPPKKQADRQKENQNTDQGYARNERQSLDQLISTATEEDNDKQKGNE